MYFDPLARKTTGLSIGGITITGGDANSFYVKKGDEIAFKLQKKRTMMKRSITYSMIVQT